MRRVCLLILAGILVYFQYYCGTDVSSTTMNLCCVMSHSRCLEIFFVTLFQLGRQMGNERLHLHVKEQEQPMWSRNRRNFPCRLMILKTSTSNNEDHLFQQNALNNLYVILPCTLVMGLYSLRSRSEREKSRN